MAALGRPVVPDVNAIMATSSAAVATAAKSPGFPAARWARSSGPSPPNVTMPQAGHARVGQLPVNRWSHRASRGCATWQMVVSSLARSSDMVATATPPALSTPSQHAASQGLFGPRSSTRLPGTRPRSSVSTRATWLEMRRTSA